MKARLFSEVTSPKEEMFFKVQVFHGDVLVSLVDEYGITIQDIGSFGEKGFMAHTLRMDVDLPFLTTTVEMRRRIKFATP